MGKPRLYKKCSKSLHQIKTSLDTRIEDLKEKELENYNLIIQNRKYNIQQGFTNFVSEIIRQSRI